MKNSGKQNTIGLYLPKTPQDTYILLLKFLSAPKELGFLSLISVSQEFALRKGRYSNVLKYIPPSFVI